MDEDIKYMNTTPQMVYALEKILDYLSENQFYSAKINNIEIKYNETLEDTANGKRQIFIIQRKVK